MPERAAVFRIGGWAPCVFASLVVSACGANDVAVPPDEPVVPEPVPGEDTCGVARAGSGFVNAAIVPARNVIVAEVLATPSAGDLDAVHGLARGRASTPGDLAAAFRFAPSGVIEVRDGETYRADRVVTYVANTPYKVRIIADLASRTYSVTAGRGKEVLEIAHDVRFAAEAGDVPVLDTHASVVRSAGGSVELCALHAEAPDVQFRRPGVHAVLADAGVISDGRTTTRIGARGEVLATYPRGGELAIDAAGNLYIARVDGGTLTIESVTPAFAPRWSYDFHAPIGSHVAAAAVTSAGDVTFLLSDPFLLVQLDPDGKPRWTREVDADAVVPNGIGYALARTGDATLTVEQRDRDGQLVWTRSWPNNVTVDHIASSPSGQIVFGGSFTGVIGFGGALIEERPPAANGIKNVYVAAMSPAGEHVFSTWLGEQVVTAIAARDDKTIVAAHHDIGPLLTTRYVLDQTGEVTEWREGLAGFGWFGRTHRLSLAADGRVFWSYGPTWPDYHTEWPQLVAY